MTLRPAPPEDLATLNALLGPGLPGTVVAALDAAEVHRETRSGQHTTEAFGRYCRIAVPALLRRLLAVETALLTVRTKVAEHVAAHDRGDDPTAGDLLAGLQRAGIDLRAEVDDAAAVLDAEAHAAATG
ncbi:hypothetical protein [Streptomyces sp. NPDC047315]|uniref:hypothetical protein n=1 Tax=Streptomyces sp. NPDC047315 TaxID=3155142 RepID=UPI0033FD697C